MPTPQIGRKAPDFTLPAGDGRIISLSSLKGKKVVLYFYPKDDTPGCTRQACSFQENIASLQNEGALVIGVSADSPVSHSRFADKYSLSFPLISDEKKEIIRRYGVWKEKQFMGRKYMGIERTTFIIDEEGMIRHIFRKVKVNGHTGEVLETLMTIR